MVHGSFVVLLVYVLIPVTLALLGMIWSYLNNAWR